MALSPQSPPYRLLMKSLPCRQSALLLRIIAIFTLMASLVPVASAQDFEGQTISSVVFRTTGGGTLNDARLRNTVDAAAGKKYNSESLDEDVKNLYTSGFIDDVTLLAEPVGNRVRVIFEVTARPTLGGVGFDGNGAFSDRKLAARIKMQAGGALTDNRILEARREIEQQYLDFGYADVSVTYALQPTAQAGVSDLIFIIDEGGKSVVRKILFEGNNTFSDIDLRKEMETRQKGFFSFITKSGQIDNEILQQDVEKVLDYYRDRGFVRVSSPGVRRRDVPGSDKVDLIIPINEGARYTVSRVGFGKLNVYSPEEIAPALVLKAGAPYSGSKLREDITTIRRYYGFKGYADVQVTHDIQNTGPNSVSVTYQVKEGRAYRVGRVNISGNNFTQDRVIRREVPLKPGDAFNTVDLEATRKRLENLNYFSRVQASGSPSAQAGYRDIDIRLDEKKTGQISFGVGFSSIDSVVGFVNLEQTNFDIRNPWSFRGGGQRFSASVRAGGERQEARVRLVEPWFLGRKLSLGGELFFESASFFSESYDQSNAGGAIFLRKPIDNFSYVRLQYRLEDIGIDVDSDAGPLFQAEDGDFIRSALSANYVFDNRDSQVIPRKGGKLDIGLEYAGLGGDVDVLKVSLEGQKHWNLPFDTILTVRGGANVSDGIGGDDVPIFDRQFIGGQRNLRGFEFRDIGGPRDAVSGDVLGGATAAYATIEYTAPVVESVRAAVFYDIGYVNEDAFDFAPDDVYSDFGVGLRLFLPFGPLAIDYAVPVSSPDEEADKGGQFQFYLNYQF